MYSVTSRYSCDSDQSVPSYSSEPLAGEHRLEFIAPVTRSPTSTGTYTKANGGITLFLAGQEDGADLPTYGRNGVIRGEVFLNLKEQENISAVTLKIDGIIDLTIAEGGTSITPVVAKRITLWQHRSSDDTCPEVIPLECSLPSTYQDCDRQRPLPPTFEYCSPGVPGLFAKCIYTLTVEIIKVRNLAFWKRRKSLVVPLNYYPHTRPHRPILPGSLGFLSTVKNLPEEWRQVACTMETRPNSGFQPIHCHLFIPSAQIFAITDTIPFHVQLSAPLSSLKALVAPPPRPTVDYRYPINLSPPVKTEPFIRVYLLRQIIVSVYGQKAWRNYVMGEGTLRQLPPMPSNIFSEIKGCETLNWEGEVRCAESIRTGGFNVGILIIKDFIVVALYPPRPATSPLLELQHAHPIRIVTDPWSELPGIPEARL